MDYPAIIAEARARANRAIQDRWERSHETPWGEPCDCLDCQAVRYEERANLSIALRNLHRAEALEEQACLDD